ncbi:MAG TPA: methyl-accepting chemotaxis protein [Planctomycetaceae bacterium]|nr:methyl-accepting chemotaxis protein [Planctomycetaceae bacterium]
MSKNLTTVRKVGLGFGLITLVLVAAVSLTLWQVSQTQAITHQLVNQSSPMTEASLRIINGVNYGISQLRGWILLDDEKFKTNRALAWSDWIEPSLAELKRLVDESGNQTQKDQIKLAEEKLREMKEFQKQAEDIVRTEKNFPATELFTAQAAPKGNEIIAAITMMIETESKLEATVERKQLLYLFANFRSSLGNVMSCIRDNLLFSGDSGLQRFELLWQENGKRFDEIESQAELLMGTESQQWQRLTGLRSEFEGLATRVLDLRKSDSYNVAVAMIRDKGTPNARIVRDTLQKFISDLEPLNEANRESLVSMTAVLMTLEWTLLAAGVVISAGLATLIIRNVERSIADVIASTQEVGTSSTEISTGSQQQVASLNETATSLNEITSTAEEFKATMQEFADRARAVQEAAVETAQRSREGRSLAQQSASRIEQVRMNSQSAGESVLNLAEQMQRIGEITATVNEIAEQTKLLALNASIEAARAGEEGRGFAVVATQVRELANQSKQAASRIESLIGTTQKSMQEVVGKIEDGGRLADQSTEIVRNMTDSFDRIANAISQTTEAMTQITTGAKQQELGISELVSSITEIDSASKESLAASQQTLRAIVSIDTQIKSLNDTMASF